MRNYFLKKIKYYKPIDITLLDQISIPGKMVSKQELLDSHGRILPYMHQTPVLTSRLLNEITEAHIYFKCENFQRMGAFKIRGATNALLNLPREKQKQGVVTHSSGNFAQALSLAAKNLEIPAYIVMPSSAPTVKKEAVKSYHGKITECAPTLNDRIVAANKIQKETGATFIHSSNNLDVITGQGTAALELLQDYPDLDFIFTPVGGGGLIAGTALAVKHFSERAKTVGGEPFEVDDAFRSFKSG